MATYMYTTVFASFRLGYGSTIAAAMFLVVMPDCGPGPAPDPPLRDRGLR